MSINPPGTGTSSTSSNVTGTLSSGSVTGTTGKILGQDDFLKLMIAELKNQDPSQSVDSTQYVAQLAQFSALEQMTNVVQAVDKLNSDMTTLSQQTLLTQGAALIGKEVSGTDAAGNKVQGTVSQVNMQNGEVQLQIGSSTLNLNQVNTISQP